MVGTGLGLGWSALLLCLDLLWMPAPSHLYGIPSCITPARFCSWPAMSDPHVLFLCAAADHVYFGSNRPGFNLPHCHLLLFPIS